MMQAVAFLAHARLLRVKPRYSTDGPAVKIFLVPVVRSIQNNANGRHRLGFAESLVFLVE